MVWMLMQSTVDTLFNSETQLRSASLVHWLPAAVVMYSRTVVPFAFCLNVNAEHS